MSGPDVPGYPGGVGMEYFKIGYIANTLGIKGEIKVLLLSNIPDRFKDLEECYINTGAGRLRVEVERHRPYKTGSIALKLKGYDDANSVPFQGNISRWTGTTWPNWRRPVLCFRYNRL